MATQSPKTTISLATPDDSAIHRRPYYDMQCDAEMMQQLINQAQQLLKQSTCYELTS